jgi:ElaB/YqjD/DUF883 family membrane-anchored ribosome-binding protein
MSPLHSWALFNANMCGDLAMMISRNNAIAEKKDLHVGGLGSRASAGLATMVESPMDSAVDATDVWLEKARDAAKSANDYVRDNPWAALGFVALIGVAAGYLLSRRS